MRLIGENNPTARKSSVNQFVLFVFSFVLYGCWYVSFVLDSWRKREMYHVTLFPALKHASIEYTNQQRRTRHFLSRFYRLGSWLFKTPYPCGVNCDENERPTFPFIRPLATKKRGNFFPTVKSRTKERKKILFTGLLRKLKKKTTTQSSAESVSVSLSLLTWS